MLDNNAFNSSQSSNNKKLYNRGKELFDGVSSSPSEVSMDKGALSDSISSIDDIFDHKGDTLLSSVKKKVNDYYESLKPKSHDYKQLLSVREKLVAEKDSLVVAAKDIDNHIKYLDKESKNYICKVNIEIKKLSELESEIKSVDSDIEAVRTYASEEGLGEDALLARIDLLEGQRELKEEMIANQRGILGEQQTIYTNLLEDKRFYEHKKGKVAVTLMELDNKVVLTDMHLKNANSKPIASQLLGSKKAQGIFYDIQNSITGKESESVVKYNETMQDQPSTAKLNEYSLSLKKNMPRFKR